MSNQIETQAKMNSEKQPPSGLLGRIRSSLQGLDMGILPIILGIFLVWAIFQIANNHFLSSLNLTNLMLQIAAEGTITVGIILVLLLGDLDLSVGSVSGLCAGIMAVLNVKAGWPGWLAILVGIASGVLIGLFQGFWIVKIRVPAFIVTLAGMMGWEGALLLVLGNTGTVNIRDPFILSLAGTFYPHWVGWLVAGIGIVLSISSIIHNRVERKKSGLPVTSWVIAIIKCVLVTAVIIGAIIVMNGNRGLPSAVVIFVGLVVIFDFITQKTKFGRYVYAVGGNADAARRAGINVDRIRITVFTIASTMAAVGGILAASRLLAVNQASGSGDLQMNTIAAAVIGGTSLFGGVGNVWSALIGTIMIGSISNGMDLLAFPSSIKFIITAVVLVISVTIDAVSKRKREAKGN
jgi:D-xylose transport system permease protein